MSQIDALEPDIAIMDINIPIMNGLKVIQLSRIKHPSTAFVIVSGYDDFSYCREALRLQITDYILKPVNYEEFGACLEKLKISLFENQRSEESGKQEERAINGITRYLQEHLVEEVSLSVLAGAFHLFHSPLTNTESSKGLPIPKEFKADAQKVGYGLADHIWSKKFVITHSAIQTLQMKFSYRHPLYIGKIMTTMTKRAAEKTE